MAFPFRRFKNTRLIWLLVVGVVLLFGHSFGILRPVESLLARVLTPVMRSVTDLCSVFHKSYSDSGINNYPELLSTAEADRRRLVMENAGLQYLREENRVLRKYVNLFDEISHKYVLARVVSRLAPQNKAWENDRLVIDQGSKQKIIPGLLVINEEGLVVGRIVSVKDSLSEVALLTSRDCRLSVAANSSQKTIGIAEGISGLTVGVSFIPQTEKIEAGELLVTSGLEPDIPAGLAIGRVTRVDRLDNKIWQSAVVEPSAALDVLRIVSILLPASDNH